MKHIVDVTVSLQPRQASLMTEGHVAIECPCRCGLELHIGIVDDLTSSHIPTVKRAITTICQEEMES